MHERLRVSRSCALVALAVSPKCICALQIHRAFIDDADDTQTLPGVYIVEWTLLGRIFFLRHCRLDPHKAVSPQKE